MTRLCLALAAVALSAAPALAQQQALSAASPDGKQTVTAKDRIVNVTDNGTQKLVMSVRAHRADITGLSYSPDAKLIGSVDKDGALYLFDVATGKELRKIQAQKGGGTLTFSGDGKTLEVKAPNNTKQFDIATGKEQ